SCKEIYNQQGINIDRKSFSIFKKLGKKSISFTSTFDPLFKIRKNILLNSINNINNLKQISFNQFYISFEKRKFSRSINISELLNEFIQNVTGEYFWNENNKIYRVDFLDKEFKSKKIHVIEVLMISFQNIYFDSKKIWNRIIKLPLTLESYRLHRNIKNIRSVFNQMINNNSGSETVKYIIKESLKYNLSLDVLLDDLIVTTSSGLNIIKLTIMSVIWHLYNEQNSKWKTDILKEIQMIEIDYEKISKCKILNAFIYEVLRYESSFSLLNNQVINDFDLDVNGRKYKIKKGTMIMPNAYVIHHNNSSWNETSDLNIFDPSRFIDNNYLGSDFFVPFETLNEVYDLCSKKSQIEKIEKDFKDVIEYCLENQDSSKA
ncbi:11557_t:CDS:2, partial [Cetraspora pellucida]